jgi:hypothetical protein
MEYVTKFIIYLLAVYGALVLLFDIFSLIRVKIRSDGSKFKLVLIVKNAGGCIEYVVHNIIKKVLTDNSFPIRDLTVIDMDSNDDTAVIAAKLDNDFSSVEFLKDKNNLFKDFQ